jgi:hypothetical protein
VIYIVKKINNAAEAARHLSVLYCNNADEKHTVNVNNAKEKF